MPRNPLLGIPQEDEEIVENAPETEAEEADEEIEEEVEEEKPPAKERKASAKASKKAVDEPQAAPAALEVGTLGDAVIDESIPMSAKAKVYLGLLVKSPLVASIIPPDVLNEDSKHTFCINSLRIVVPKGKMIRVPLMLAEEIKQSFSNRF